MSKTKQVYNRFTKEEFIKSNEENKKIREDFLLSLKGMKSKESIIQYSNDSKIIIIYCLRECDNKNIIYLKKKDFLKMRIYFNENCGMSNARTNRLMSVCRMMLAYVESDDELTEDLDKEFINYAQKVTGLPKEPVRTNEDDFFINFGTIMKARNELIKAGKLQQAVFLMLGFDSAGRKQELTEVLKYGLTESLRTEPVRGKGGKRFRLNYLPDTQELIKQWLEKRGDDDIENLFIIDDKEGRRPATSNNLYLWMKDDINPILSKIEGKDIEAFAHSLRHSRAEILSQGLDDRLKNKDGTNRKYSLEEIQVLLNHSSSATTQGYLKNHTDDIIKQMFGYDEEDE